MYPNVKTIKNAVPTINADTGKVKRWDIEVIFKHTNASNVSWSRTYSHSEDVAYLNKLPEAFSKAELISFLNSNMDEIFDAHYEAHNVPPKETKLSEFDINDLQ
jgi:hypothetical protein